MKQTFTTKKLLMVVLTAAVFFVTYSCTTVIPGYPNNLSGTSDSLVKQNHYIDSSIAWTWIARYKANKDKISNNQITIGTQTYRDILPESSESFNKVLLEKIVLLKNCVGTHIYFGMSEDYKVHLLLSGIGPNYETLYIDGSYSAQSTGRQKGAAPPPSGGGMGEYGLKP